MRASHLATALASFAAGLAAASLLRRATRRAAPAPAAEPLPAAPAEGPDAVVLAFPRPVVVERPAGPARCGDSGGVTRAGAPCAARATSGGRCHHHPAAA
ncbi:hypothetical protein SAMN05660690_1791 [Geodermatophilus telluris]|uniref:Uncharacterized protein n=1 Tax=Geodermatophilus telluris TaxID=1190417 RepID=A0A1G6MCC1_9ACTN|nr:hypothetical protein [Geodermatophilus telluris]SDC53232.1 hypothetical protein SAMN05660690_1791 [Geodermatophilus telluris]